MKLFSGDSLCPEAKQEVCKAFAQNPDLSGLADWSGALAKLGLSLSKEDVDKVMQQAVKSAVELLKHDFNNSKVLTLLKSLENIKKFIENFLKLYLM